MKITNKIVSEKSRKSSLSIMMYVASSVVAIIGIALLVNNILLFKSTVSDAVAQGYAVATVRKALLTSQLLPGVFEPIAVYGGIAFILLGIGKANIKVSKCLILLTKVETCNDTVEEILVEQDVVDAENTDTIVPKTDNIEPQIGTVEEVKSSPAVL